MKGSNSLSWSCSYRSRVGVWLKFWPWSTGKASPKLEAQVWHSQWFYHRAESVCGSKGGKAIYVTNNSLDTDCMGWTVLVLWLDPLLPRLSRGSNSRIPEQTQLCRLPGAPAHSTTPSSSSQYGIALFSSNWVHRPETRHVLRGSMSAPRTQNNQVTEFAGEPASGSSLVAGWWGCPALNLRDVAAGKCGALDFCGVRS